MYTVTVRATNGTKTITTVTTFSDRHEARSTAGKAANSAFAKSVVVTDPAGNIIFRVVRGHPEKRIYVPA